MRSQQKSREHDSVMLPAFYAEKRKRKTFSPAACMADFDGIYKRYFAADEGVFA